MSIKNCGVWSESLKLDTWFGDLGHLLKMSCHKVQRAEIARRRVESLIVLDMVEDARREGLELAAARRTQRRAAERGRMCRWLQRLLSRLWRR